VAETDEEDDKPDPSLIVSGKRKRKRPQRFECVTEWFSDEESTHNESDPDWNDTLDDGVSDSDSDYEYEADDESS